MNSDSTPQFKRLKRPAVISEQHFSTDQSAGSPSKLKRLQRPAVVSEVSFEPCAVLELTLAWPSDADAAHLALTAALLKSEISRIDEDLGGVGFELDPRGIIQSGPQAVMRLVSKCNTGSTERVQKVMEKLKEKMLSAKEDVRTALPAANNVKAAEHEAFRRIQGIGQSRSQAA